MVMGFEFLRLLVTQVKKAEVPIQPASFYIAIYVSVLLVVHKCLRLIEYSSMLFL